MNLAKYDNVEGQDFAWLQAEVYGRAADVPVHEITALSRFSERIWQIG